MKTKLYFLIVALLPLQNLYAQDGAVDQTFANNAVYALINNTELMSELIFDVQVTDDGKIVVAGTAGNLNDHEFIVARLNADGTFDNTFGTNGIAQFNYSPGNSENLVGIVLQGDKIVIGAHTTNSGAGDFLVLRLDESGEIDLTFGGGGSTMVDIGTNSVDIAKVIKLDAQGRIVIAGSSEVPNGPNGPDLAVIRLTADGALDNSFSADGKLVWAVVNNEDVVKDVVFDADGNIFLVGEAISAGQRKIVVGALDSAGGKIFAYGGSNTARVLHEFEPGNNCVVNSAVMRDNGSILLVGASEDNVLYGASMQLDATGALDLTYNLTGTITFGIASEINQVISIYDGFLLCGSVLADGDPSLNSLVIRLNDVDGDIVNTFASGGILNEDVAEQTNDMAFGIATQGNGHAIVVGSFGDNVIGIAGFVYRITVNQQGLGISESSRAQMTVYPNPAVQSITLPSTVETGAAIQIFDMKGAQVHSGVARAGGTVDVSHLPNGIYTVLIGTEATARFVKQ